MVTEIWLLSLSVFLCGSLAFAGFLPAGFVNCNQNLTILSHAEITFTGCKPYTGSYPGSLPTGVSDGGVPALKCVKAENPPSVTSRPNAEYGVYEICETSDGGVC